MFETGAYIIDVYVDTFENRTELGDIGERVLYCCECDNSEFNDHGNRICYAWGEPEIVEEHDWCSRRHAKRTEGV